MNGDQIVKLWHKIKSERVLHDSSFENLAKLHWPSHSSFLTTETIYGAMPEKNYLVTPINTIFDQAVNMIVGLTAPSGQRWHDITIDDKELEQDPEVREYLERLQNFLFEVRYRSGSNFTRAYRLATKSNLVFGNAALYVDDPKGDGSLTYDTIPVSHIWITTDQYNRVDGFFRTKHLTARQIVNSYGDEATIPLDITSSSKEDSPKKYCVLIYYKKADEGALWQYESFHVLSDYHLIMKKGGFRTTPISFSRDDVPPGYVYGFGFGHRFYHDSKRFDAIEKDKTIAARYALKGVSISRNDSIQYGQKFLPGAHIPGGIDQDGRRAFDWLYPTGRIDVADNMQATILQTISTALTINMLEIVAEKPNMTAKEILKRAEERGMMLAPLVQANMDILQGNFQRELDLVIESGAIGAPPQELLQSGKPMQMRFVSPVKEIMDAGDVRRIMDAFGIFTTLAQVDGNILRKANPAKIMDHVERLMNLPHGMFKNEEEYNDSVASAQQQQAQLAMLQQAPDIARAIKDGAQAEKIRSTI